MFRATVLILRRTIVLTYILESNPHPFYTFRGLKQSDVDYNLVRIRFAVESWILEKKIDGAAVRAVRTIQYNNLLFYSLLIIIHYSSYSPSSLTTESLSKGMSKNFGVHFIN
jgi:hypothetical protein